MTKPSKPTPDQIRRERRERAHFVHLQRVHDCLHLLRFPGDIRLFGTLSIHPSPFREHVAGDPKFDRFFRVAMARSRWEHRKLHTALVAHYPVDRRCTLRWSIIKRLRAC